MKFSLKNIRNVLIWLCIAGVVCLFLKSDIKLFNADVLITYIGLLIGFSITIYTFGLTLIPQIKDLIENDKTITPEDKEMNIRNMLEGFNELKEDVRLISYCLIVSIMVIICQVIDWNITIPFILTNRHKIVSFVKLSLLLLSTRTFIDLVNSLLTISIIFTKLVKNAKKL